MFVSFTDCWCLFLCAKEIVVSDEANQGSSDSASLCSYECRSSDYSSSSSSNTQSTITEVDDLCALDDLDVTSKPLASALATAHPGASPERSEYTESLERSDQRSSDNQNSCIRVSEVKQNRKSLG